MPSLSSQLWHACTHGLPALAASIQSGRSARSCAPGNKLFDTWIFDGHISYPSTGTVWAGHTPTIFIYSPTYLPIKVAILTSDGTFIRGLQGLGHPHHDAMPARTAQTCNKQSILLEVLPVHGNEALALRAQAQQVQLLSFQRPCQGVLIGARSFGSRARHRQCGLQALLQYSHYT